MCSTYAITPLPPNIWSTPHSVDYAGFVCDPLLRPLTTSYRFYDPFTTLLRPTIATPCAARSAYTLVAPPSPLLRNAMLYPRHNASATGGKMRRWKGDSHKTGDVARREGSFSGGHFKMITFGSESSFRTRKRLLLWVSAPQTLSTQQVTCLEALQLLNIGLQIEMGHAPRILTPGVPLSAALSPVP